MILIPNRSKYMVGGTAKKGKVGGGNDQGTKHLRKTKANDAQRAVIKATQPKKVMHLLGAKRTMLVVPK